MSGATHRECVRSRSITERQARHRGIEVKTSVLPLEYVPRALAARDTRGLIKLVAVSGTGKLSVTQRSDEIVFDDDRTAGGVDEER